jgi:meiotic recombination protein REC8, fungi type
LQDDPSFLPDFALPPAELLASLDMSLLPEAPRHGESQDLTPFGTQQDQSTPGGLVGGLLIPSTSSPQGGKFKIQGDDSPVTVGGPSDILGENGLQLLEEPDFAFDDDGNFVDRIEIAAATHTPAGASGHTMQSDAVASTWMRQQHEERQRIEAQVSSATVFHLICTTSSNICLSYSHLTSPISPRHTDQLFHISSFKFHQYHLAFH